MGKKKSKSKIIEQSFTQAIFSIQSRVVFKLVQNLSGRTLSPPTILAKDVLTESHYQFKGRGALIWLLLNGQRSVREVVSKCGIPAKSAFKFLQGLESAGLIRRLEGARRDPRDDYLKQALYQFKLQKRKVMSLRKIPLQKSRREPGDHSALLAAKNRFLKVLSPGSRILFKRELPSIRYGMHLQVFSSKVSIPGKPVTEGHGAGFTVERAAMAATGEAVERLLTFDTPPDLIARSFTDLAKLGKPALDPTSFQFFSPRQVAFVNGEVANWTRSLKLDWAAFDSVDGKKIFIPAAFNAAKAADDRRAYLGEVTSNGCAAAFDRDEAKLKATLELVERDALLFYWRTRNRPLLIDVSSPHPRLKKLLEKAGPLKNRISLFYLKTELKPVTVLAVLLGRPSLGEPQFTVGTACRLDPWDAVEKAFAELLYVFAGRIQNDGIKRKVFYGEDFDNTVWDLDDRNHLYSWTRARKAYDFLFPKSPRLVSWEDIPNTESGSSSKNLNAVITNLGQHKLRLYFRDNTPKTMARAGFFVYRAFSPDLIAFDGIHRYRHLGDKRYRTLAKKLKLRRSDSSNLNKWPNPLP